jgi:hypothetical protein
MYGITLHLVRPHSDPSQKGKPKPYLTDREKLWMFPPTGSLKLEDLYLLQVEQVGPSSLQAHIFWNGWNSFLDSQITWCLADLIQRPNSSYLGHNTTPHSTPFNHQIDCKTTITILMLHFSSKAGSFLSLFFFNTPYLTCFHLCCSFIHCPQPHNGFGSLHTPNLFMCVVMHTYCVHRVYTGHKKGLNQRIICDFIVIFKQYVHTISRGYVLSSF